MPAATIGRLTERVSAFSRAVLVSTDDGLIAIPGILAPVGAAQSMRAQRKRGAVHG